MSAFVVPTYIYFKFYAFQYLAFYYILVVCFSNFFVVLNLFILHFSCLVNFWPFSIFYLQVFEYLSNDFNEYKFEDLDDWDKPRFFLGRSGIQRTIIQLLGQLDGIELHWKKHAKRQERRRRSMASLVQPLPNQGSPSPNLSVVSC